jgi:hypothetical protein
MSMAPLRSVSMIVVASVGAQAQKFELTTDQTQVPKSSSACGGDL